MVKIFLKIKMALRKPKNVQKNIEITILVERIADASFARFGGKALGYHQNFEVKLCCRYHQLKQTVMKCRKDFY